MAKVIDPDLLALTTDVVINTGASTIEIKSTGAIDSADGVTLQCIYSFLMEEWDAAAYIPYAFPLEPITDTQFDMIEGWDFLNDSSRLLIRDGGWANIHATTANPTTMYINLTTLGTFDDATTGNAYFVQVIDGATTDISRVGPVNEPILVYTDTNGDGTPDTDYTDHFEIYLRERGVGANGETFDYYDLLTSQNITALTYKAYALPLSSSTDLNISIADTGIASGGSGAPDTAPYSSMSITWLAGTHKGNWTTATVYVVGDTVFDTVDTSTYYHCTVGGTSNNTSVATDTNCTWAQTTGTSDPLRSVNSILYPYHIILNGGGSTSQKIYEFVQYMLRQTIDIDSGAGTVTGETAEGMLDFVGTQLNTKLIVEGGIFIDNFDSAFQNLITFVDDTGTGRDHAVSVPLEINGVYTGDEPTNYVRVRIEASTGGDLGEGTEILNTTATTAVGDGTYKATLAFTYTNPQPVIIKARYIGYLPFKTTGTISAAGLTVTAVWQSDPNFTA